MINRCNGDNLFCEVNGASMSLLRIFKEGQLHFEDFFILRIINVYSNFPILFFVLRKEKQFVKNKHFHPTFFHHGF